MPSRNAYPPTEDASPIAGGAAGSKSVKATAGGATDGLPTREGSTRPRLTVRQGRTRDGAALGPEAGGNQAADDTAGGDVPTASVPVPSGSLDTTLGALAAEGEDGARHRPGPLPWTYRAVALSRRYPPMGWL